MLQNQECRFWSIIRGHYIRSDGAEIYFNKAESKEIWKICGKARNEALTFVRYEDRSHEWALGGSPPQILLSPEKIVSKKQKYCPLQMYFGILLATKP